MKRLVISALFAISAAASASAQKPLAEAEHTTIGYASYEEALAALEARDDVELSVTRGWKIIVDRRPYAIWSFSPDDHPSHPTVVKRQVISVGDKARIEMSVYCLASKVACDDIVREFAAMNGISLDE
jgi:hypothetical protein